MPLLDEVHSVGRDAPSSSPLPPYQIAVYVPSIVSSTSQNTPNSAVFGDEGYFTAQCAATDVVGNCVYANSTLAYVTTADASENNAVVGIIVAKSNDTNCTVQRLGESYIEFSNLIRGKRYFLGPSGEIIAPPFDDSILYVQQVGNAISETKLFVQPNGVIIRRDVSKQQTEVETMYLGKGTPNVSIVYPPQNIYINSDTGEWYSQPTDNNAPSQFFMGRGAPSDAVTYAPITVYIDNNTGAYYVKDGHSNQYVPLNAGNGDPAINTGSSYRALYVNALNGAAYNE